MARTSPTHRRLDLTIDLTDVSDPPAGHRLAELVQALTGCSIERAEFAVSDPTPTGPASSDDALRTMARAIVRLRPRQTA
ncbi:MAG: hypothetical protein ACT452_09315 [Microthrixaceae bacterium]